MDLRYEHHSKANDFHKQRRAFIIYNNVLEFIPEGSTMSHFDFCQSKGMDKDTFNSITRGFFLNGDVVFYKDNFIYDDEVIAESLKYLDEIAQIIGVEKLEIYYGELPEQGWAYTYHYGNWENGKITKFD